MPFAKGHPKPAGSGRKKGTPDKVASTATQILERLGCDPISGMVMIASGEVPCGTCHGKGKTKVKASDGTFFDRTCESCYGSLLEKVTPDLRGKMYAELAKYRHPQLKSVEMSGTLALTNEIEQRLLAGRKRAQEK
jgi:hypothetical protein